MGALSFVDPAEPVRGLDTIRSGYTLMVKKGYDISSERAQAGRRWDS